MRRKLLLADDSITVQRVIELTFADEDLDVSTVGDGGDAIARIERDKPDIVLADLTMPVRDGYGVAEHVKLSPVHAAQTRVVLLTGAFEPVDQERASELGVDGVLAKPFEPRTAIELVRTLLMQPPREAQVGPSKSKGSITATFGPRASAESPSDSTSVKSSTRSSAARASEPTAAAGYPFDAGAGTPRSSQAELDDYFKRLDEALASAGLVASSAVRDMLAESKGTADSASGAEASASKAPASETTRSSKPESSEHDLSKHESSKQRQENNVMSGMSPSAEPSPGPGAPAGSPSTGGASGTLVDAFSALLAAEQGDTAEEGSTLESRVFRPEAVRPPTLGAVQPVAMTPPVASSGAVSPVSVPTRAAPQAPAASVEPSSSAFSSTSSAAASGATHAMEPPPASAAHASAAPAAPVPAAPAPTAEQIAAAIAQNDVLIEAVAKRVVEQLGDRIVRDVVNATVVDIAERLVREEIERLKAAAGHA